jgi:hypothetical protein
MASALLYRRVTAGMVPAPSEKQMLRVSAEIWLGQVRKQRGHGKKPILQAALILRGKDEFQPAVD